jgi:uncharacterized protein YegJ (DUF2314 family)
MNKNENKILDKDNKEMTTRYTDNWKVNSDSFYRETCVSTGDFAKIGKIEGFWVEITEILSENKFIGKINNELIIQTNYKYGDFVIFERKNIMDYKSSKLVIVSTTDYVFYRGLNI